MSMLLSVNLDCTPETCCPLTHGGQLSVCRAVSSRSSARLSDQVGTGKGEHEDCIGHVRVMLPFERRATSRETEVLGHSVRLLVSMVSSEDCDTESKKKEGDIKCNHELHKQGSLPTFRLELVHAGLPRCWNELTVADDAGCLGQIQGRSIDAGTRTEFHKGALTRPGRIIS